MEITDRDKLVMLFDEFGILYEKQSFQNTDDIIIKATERNLEHSISKVYGYLYFFAAFEFHKDGTFRSVGIWE